MLSFLRHITMADFADSVALSHFHIDMKPQEGLALA